MEEYERPPVVSVNRCLIKNANKELLLIQRSEDDKHNPGKWEFPGGKLDDGENLIPGTIRETLEETGLLVEPELSPVFAEGHYIRGGKHKGSIYLALYWYAKIIGGEIKLSEEHDNFVWKSEKEASKLDLTPGSRKTLKELGKTALKNIKRDNEPPEVI